MNRPLACLLAALSLLANGVANAASCEAYYPFDGSLNDASGNGYHGLMIPAANAAAPAFVEGRIGQALHLTGSAMHSFIDLHHQFCPQVTITAWFRMPAASASGNQTIFSTGGGVGPGVYIQGGAIHVEGTGNGLYHPNAVRDADDWLFIAVAYDYEALTYTLIWRNRPFPGELSGNLGDVENAFWVGTFNDSMSYTARDLYIDDLRIHSGVLTAEEIRGIQTGNVAPPAAETPELAASTLAEALPTCSTHSDCEAGSYCAWDNTCHPERHAPKQALTFQPVQIDLAQNILLSEDARTENEPEPAPVGSGGSPAPTEPYGAGNPSFTSVAGVLGEVQQRLDLEDEFLTRIRLWRPEPGRGPACRIWANGTELDLCGSGAGGSGESITAELQGSYIASLSTCGPGLVTGMHVSGNVINPDGTTRYEPVSGHDEYVNCGELAEVVDDIWSATQLCAVHQLATGVVVHSSTGGTIKGLQLICRRIAFR